MIKKIILVLFIISTVTFLSCIEEKTKKIFLKAIRKGNIAKVRMMLVNDSDLNYYISQDAKALITCAIGDQFEIAKLLIEKGSTTNATNIKSAPLNWVKSLKMAKLFVENGAEINRKSESERTAIYKLAQEGNYDILKYLFENGAEIYHIDSLGRIISVTNAALSLNDNSYLFTEPNLTQKQKERILLDNKNRKRFVEYVVENSENINEYDPNKNGILSSLQLGYHQLAENMLKQYALNDSIVNRKILVNASRFNNINIVKKLVKNGVAISSKPEGFPLGYRWYPITAAAKNGNKEILEYLLTHRNISPNKNEVDMFFASDRELNSALLYSLNRKHTECSLLLLEHGASTGVLGRQFIILVRGYMQ